MHERFGRVGATFAAIVVSAILYAELAGPVAACSGGELFDWAVAHEHGGILQGRVTSVTTNPDYSTRLVLAQRMVVRGNPPAALKIDTVAGLVCDQTAEIGETVMILFDLRGVPDDVKPLPFYYVVKGSDALNPAEVADGLAALPPTDAADPATSEPAEPTAALVALLAGLVGAAVTLRRIRARRSPQARLSS